MKGTCDRRSRRVPSKGLHEMKANGNLNIARVKRAKCTRMISLERVN